MKMHIINKILGLILCAIGVGIGYVEYLIICGINGIGIWIISAIGVTGDAATGVGILVYIPVIVLLVGVFLLICIIMWLSIVVFFSDDEI